MSERPSWNVFIAATLVPRAGVHRQAETQVATGWV